MPAFDDFGKWAAAFLQQYRGTAEPQARPRKYEGITPEAEALLESIDAGGVPAFMTANLMAIARDNGLAVGQQTTPNDIVAALRRMATTVERQPPPRSA